ncbi:uncharacterized protein BX663DRAFT_515226 [Cokeromyces recurvatus]|uniref:uncharacterized protein n=1 Tax=Cokeromyces recurvatus TaxID=90255 RepID=UPI00221F30D1|nr:uncharacterized protein BX663DRAFT_515226 [Cokeromyces recurvatus]KAI7901195.1 hypothetical protein BX663DRAFT_515226 [Cokeromyces recurvatus]
MAKYGLPDFPLFKNLVEYATNKNNIAIDDARMCQNFTYLHLIHAVAKLRLEILNGKSNLNEERIAILCPSGFPYVISLLAIWAAGGIAVPLCTTHPAPEQMYTLQDSQVSFILGHPLFTDRLEELTKATQIPYKLKDDASLIELTDGLQEDDNTTLTLFSNQNFNAGALIIYTSGTTGKPKGAATTHAIINAQASVLVKAWHWSSSDRIHHILPLHHIHGIVNALICPLYCGATVEMHPKFDAMQVWTRWAQQQEEQQTGSMPMATGGLMVVVPRLTVFMSVPTVYAKLYHFYKEQSPETQRILTNACRQFRLMVSGSASLPTTLRNNWRKLSGGQVLLERYGMTEIGMALSQEYIISERVQGTVGIPLPGVQARIISVETNKDVTELREVPGMLQIKGDTVFKEYWNRPEATKKEFTTDGWFITGDIAKRVGHSGYFQIMGRNSIDIIKTGGEKVSALEIERELLSCDLNIKDVAVVGIPDPEWGQKVAAVVVMEDGKELDLLTMRNAMKKRVAVYKVPSLLKIVTELPKNAMGKVTKKNLISLF